VSAGGRLGPVRSRPVVTRPVVSRPVLILLAMSGALFVVARTSGAGWVMVLVSGLWATIVVAGVWPVLLLSTVSVSITAPRDATAGRPLVMHVSVGGQAQALKLRVVSPAGQWAGVAGPAAGETTVVPEHRGVVSHAVVELRGAGPVGLVWWKTRRRLRLAHPIEVGPVPIEPARLPVAGAGGVGGEWRAGSGLDVVRGVREYVAGDPARLVHWPVSARHGSLVVKELEDPASRRLAIVVDLRGPGGGETAEAAEAAASHAAGLAVLALRAGFAVTMATAESDGGRVAAVKTRIDVSRRLARAVAAEPPEGPFPPSTEVVRVTADGAQ